MTAGIVAAMSTGRDGFFGHPGPSLRQTLGGRGARRWFVGGLVGLAWLVQEGVDAFGRLGDPVDRAVLIVLLVLFGAAFLVIPPLNWSLPTRYRLLLPTALWALSFGLVPILGLGVYSLWVFVGVAAAMSLVPFRVIVIYIASVTAATGVVAWIDGARGDLLFSLPVVTASISLMMVAFARLIVGMNQLRATQHELARLAVEQERSRVAREMHDILGHSLTVITVKAELAGRLVATEPERAAAELSEVEALARAALADVRATVSGYRGISLVSEIANARSALASAGIDAILPGSVDIVPAEYRDLFAWVVREGVTNVLRHSGARRCEVRLGAAFIEVEDDGDGSPAGMVRADENAGVGLAGLRERAHAAGLALTAVAGPGSRGFVLRVGE